MELNTNNYSFAGFFSSGSIGFIHFGDIAMAIILGFFGALGAFLFKIAIDWYQKKK